MVGKNAVAVAGTSIGCGMGVCDVKTGFLIVRKLCVTQRV